MGKSRLAWPQYVLAATALTIITPCLLRAQGGGQRAVALSDLLQLREVSDPHVSPDGQWVAYTVTVPDTVEDRDDADVWMTSWDGTRTLRLTTSNESESMPRWSPAGRYLAFVSSRGHARDAAQLWLLDRAGGEAERITDFPGGVEDYVWSPDGRRLAVIARDPDNEREGDDSTKTRRPIVIDRFQFKQDEVGYLDTRRDHLYLVEIASRKSVLLTPGPYNEALPSWAPDGNSISFVSKRRDEFDRDNNWDVYVIGTDSGSAPRQITTFEGPDADPDYASRPVFSPDGKFIAYLEGGAPELIWYGVQRIAIVPVDGGAARILTGNLDRNVWNPQWSSDGTSILFLLEDDRSTHLASVRLADGGVRRLQTGRGFASAFSIGGDNIAVLTSTPHQPAEVFALERAGLRQISQQNDAWLAEVRLASVEETEFASTDGTSIGGFVVKPPDFRPDTRYPTVLWIHGGPVYQFSNEFDFTWQLLAAHGYAVVTANPRGSSGKGMEFQRTIVADWGNKDARDVLAAVDHVVAAGIADPNRLGVGGWSYGGMLTNYVIAQDTRFKAAVSGSSISNILAGYGTDQYIREYEIELGRPWENLEAWLRVSFPFLHANRIVTPTLFLCGELDFNVPLLNSEQMYQALRSLGIETQLVIYPGQYHSITKPSYQLDRLERYIKWYDRFLKSERSADAS